MPLPGDIVEPELLPPSPLAMQGDVEVDAGTNVARLAAGIGTPEFEPGEQLGRQIDAAPGLAPGVRLTELEQGENQRKNTVFDLLLDGDAGGSGAVGQFTPTEITIPANITQIRVRTTSATDAVIAGFGSDKRDGHQVEWTLDFGSPGGVVFEFDSLQSPAVEAFLFPIINGTDTIKLTNFLDSFTFRNMAALTVGSQHWVLVATAQPHNLNRVEYLAGFVNVHNGDFFVPRRLTDSDIDFADIGPNTLRGNPLGVSGPEVDIPMPNFSVAVRGVGDLFALTFAPNSMLARPGAGDLVGLPLAADSVWTRFGGGDLQSHSWFTIAGSGLDYNGNGVLNVDFSSVTYTGGNFIDVTGTVISLEQVNAHDVLCRQSGVAGDVNTANVGSDQVLGRPSGSGDVLQGTQVLTNMIANENVTFAKIEDQNPNSFMGRFTSTLGTPSSLSIATHSFPAREGGDLFTKSFTSLAGDNLTYDSGTGQLNAAGSGVPENNNAVIIRNGAGTLIALSMIDNSVLIRSGSGALSSFNFFPDSVLRRDGSGNLTVGLLVTGNYGNNSVTAAKVDTGDNFSWTGQQNFGSAVHLQGVQFTTLNLGNNDDVAVLANTNVIRFNATSPQNVSGLDMNALTSGRLVACFNISTDSSAVISLLNEGGASAAANQFRLHTTAMRMARGTGVWVWHDAATNRNRVMSSPTVSGLLPQG